MNPSIFEEKRDAAAQNFGADGFDEIFRFEGPFVLPVFEAGEPGGAVVGVGAAGEGGGAVLFLDLCVCVCMCFGW